MGVGETVIAILAEQAVLDPAGITPEMRLEELGIDSLGLVEAIFAIEETFDVTVPFNAGEPGKNDFKVTTVGEMIAGVEALVAGTA
ncbi:acyl carrier protein [Albidovulum sp.]|uniref:acyl carrier protein n=1 Tax=Albidovulum sp. TaxID=1872424 RepID=UPI001D7EEBAC|nr:acyl carrier protein [Paracoccaceae bacterium]